MKTNIYGFDVECTVEEFRSMLDLGLKIPSNNGSGRVSSRTRWSKVEIADLMRLRGKEYSFETIAKRLNRSVSSVIQAYHIHKRV